jgi:hypothetical protein
MEWTSRCRNDYPFRLFAADQPLFHAAGAVSPKIALCRTAIERLPVFRLK